MTREEYVKRYAKENGLSDQTARFRTIIDKGVSLVSLPCACGSKGCEGWVMLEASGVDHHLRFSAPEELRTAYWNAIGEEQ